MPMKNTSHPGPSVRLNCLEPFGLSVTEGAKALGVSRTTLSRLINGQAGVSPEMAIRLAKAFGATPQSAPPQEAKPAKPDGFKRGTGQHLTLPTLWAGGWTPKLLARLCSVT